MPASTAGPVTAISAGGGQTCTLADGRVLCWGSNYFGQLGNGATVDSSTPVEAQGLSGATAIGAGNDHACALAGGRVLCWGQNWSGQLGDGTTDDSSSTPVAVPGLSGVTAISAGDTHTCAVADGLVLCWGSNLSGQLGDGTTVASSTPVEAQRLSGATAISAGLSHTCAMADGRVLCWGSNLMGQLGDGTTVDLLACSWLNTPPPPASCWSSSPVEVQGLADATAVSAGTFYTCALADGRVLCWGSNYFGQLGDGTTVDPEACLSEASSTGCWSSSPVEVPGLADATAISAGKRHTCALAGGRVLCWGANSKGQLGNGATVDSSTPVEVQGL